MLIIVHRCGADVGVGEEQISPRKPQCLGVSSARDHLFGLGGRYQEIPLRPGEQQPSAEPTRCGYRAVAGKSVKSERLGGQSGHPPRTEKLLRIAKVQPRRGLIGDGLKVGGRAFGDHATHMGTHLRQEQSELASG